MEFDKDVGRLQRLMAASIAGVNRRQAILETLSINPETESSTLAAGLASCLGTLQKGLESMEK